MTAKIHPREIAFNKIKDRVKANGGFLTVYMRELREAYKVSKLGDNVNNKISRELRAVGLGHANILTKDQWDSVRLYQKGHPAEDLINAFNKVDANQDDADEILINACQSRNSSALRDAFQEITDIVNSIEIDLDD
jgi:hypothetical protein